MATERLSKLEENVESFSNGSTDTDMPVWAKMLFVCFKSLIAEFKLFNDVAERISNLEDTSNVQKVVIEKLEIENKRLNGEIVEMKKAINHNEQRSRLPNLLIHGITEEDGKSCDAKCLQVINDRFKIKLEINDLERTHSMVLQKEHV